MQIVGVGAFNGSAASLALSKQSGFNGSGNKDDSREWKSPTIENTNRIRLNTREIYRALNWQFHNFNLHNYALINAFKRRS